MSTYASKGVIMNKNELARSLKRFGQEQRGRHRGQNVLALFLADFFQRLVIAADEKYDFWTIEDRIAQLLVGAIEEFRTSDDPSVAEMRATYEGQVGHPMPDLMDVTGNGLDQALTVQSLGFLFEEVTGEGWVSKGIDQVFNAQRYYLQQQVLVFVAKVFTKGLSGFIHEGQDRGMSGKFGQTTLRTYWLAGRLMMTLARPSDDESQDERSLTLICEDDDPLALGIGIQSVYTDLNTALAMIDEVINVWPSNLEDAWMMMAPDDKVGIG